MQTAVISTVGFVTRPSHMDLGRIAIFRPLGLEGLLTATPALRAVRTALPEAEVTYIGDPESGQAVGRFADYIDDFMLCPPYPGLHAGTGDAASILDFLQLAQVRRFDLAIQLHGCGLISNPLCALLGASHTAGFYLRGQYCPDPERFLVYPWHLPEALGVPQLVLQPETSDRSDPVDSTTRRLISWAGLATPDMIVQEILRAGRMWQAAHEPSELMPAVPQ